MEKLLAVAGAGTIDAPAGYIIALFARASVQFSKADAPLNAPGYIPVSSAGRGAVVLGFFIAQPIRL